jgi:hypothetical protein
MGQERELSEELAKLTKAVGKWRAARGGGRGTRIPDELWKEAVRVARVDGLWLTAKATRFNYDALKERVARAGGLSEAVRRGRRRRAPAKRRLRSSKRLREPTFVELSAPPLYGTASTTGTVVEVEGGGVRMTVRLGGEAGIEEVARLLAVFRQPSA